MLMSSQSKFSTLFVFSCAEMYICISKVLGKRQNRACNFLSSVIMKKRWIVAASSYLCIQGLRRSVLFSFLNRWAWIGWSTLNNKQMLLVCLKILAMRRGEARESGRFFCWPSRFENCWWPQVVSCIFKTLPHWLIHSGISGFIFIWKLAQFSPTQETQWAITDRKKLGLEKDIHLFFFVLSPLLCILLMKMNRSLFAETVNEL